MYKVLKGAIKVSFVCNLQMRNLNSKEKGAGSPDLPALGLKSTNEEFKLGKFRVYNLPKKNLNLQKILIHRVLVLRLTGCF